MDAQQAAAPTPSDAGQAVELPPLPDMVAIADGSFNCNAQLGTPLYTADQFRAAIAQDRAARAQAEPVLPEGWVPCTIAYTEGDDPEEIAFGPQRMMDRLKKWLDSYFAMLYAQRYPAARAQGAGEAVARRMHVECRQCNNCSHIGLNDSRDDESACKVCDWQGPSPADDVCPGCGDAGQMGAACPECGGRYYCVAEDSIQVDAAPTIPQAAEVPGFVLVPREMHSDQLHDFHYFAKKYGVEEGDAFARAIYAACLAAAPTPTASAPKAEGEALRHSTKDTGDCPHWCKACHAEAKQRESEADRTREGGDDDGNPDNDLTRYERWHGI